jgi:hypothetical protein
VRCTTRETRLTRPRPSRRAVSRCKQHPPHQAQDERGIADVREHDEGDRQRRRQPGDKQCQAGQRTRDQQSEALAVAGVAVLVAWRDVEPLKVVLAALAVGLVSSYVLASRALPSRNGLMI